MVCGSYEWLELFMPGVGEVDGWILDAWFTLGVLQSCFEVRRRVLQ